MKITNQRQEVRREIFHSPDVRRQGRREKVRPAERESLKGRRPSVISLGRWIAACLLLSSGTCAADPLTEQLTAFMQKQFTTPPAALEVVITTPLQARLNCPAPQFTLPSRNRIWGNVSVAMVCGAQKRYLQTEVKVTDRYLVAARPVAENQTLSAEDIRWQTGRLDLLSQLPLTDRQWATGSVAERPIGSGQPLTAAMLRRPWRIKIGQPVQVSAQGEGFAIQSTGKALNNAAVNDALQVRMDSGQTLNGRVMPDGSIHVGL
ncbi:flagellar basal body P-ring formation chaperone FlgA [Acerihabitans sp. KWT182]|uniref:Flagella basal body P-ring formation protein FlgA n=1 Tax=Acerihabitans sp. KWT182 TaxID=3157919 RepID=A0AAU7Q5X8_9GAMM